MAAQSTIYPLYNDLIHINCERCPFKTLKYVAKARGEGLNLNYPYRSEADVQCCMCDMKEVKNTLHFVSACPTSSQIRERLYSKKKLTKT